MSFGSPYLLVCLLAVPAVVLGYVLLERRRRGHAGRWGTPALLPNMISRAPRALRFVAPALFLLGLTFLLVGFARPEAKVSVLRQGATVVVALDISGSMAATDVHPSRLGAARQTATAFLEKLPPKYRAALVTFSDHATVRDPPTYDHGQIVRALPVKTQEEGTALGDAIETSVRVATRAVGRNRPGTKHPPATVLLISDGAQTAGRVDVPTAIKDARTNGVPVFTISLGTPDGVLERKLPGGFTERIAVPPAPAVMRQVAQQSGGRYLPAHSASALKAVYDNLGSRLVHDRKYREITAGVTGIALALIVLGALLSGIWFRRVV